MIRKKNRLSIVLVFLFIISFSISRLCLADHTTVETVTDLSDRKYEQALIQLLDNAKESIVISMYSISPGSGDKNPVRLLLNDLLEARGRGVSVTMYLNTRFIDDGTNEDSFIKSPVFKELKDAGCTIYLIPKSRRLHDKLIIVDSRYVVVGSTNWSNSALRRNFESNTLIDSPRHAQDKLKRLENVLSFIKSNSEITDTPAYLEELPKELIISNELLINKKYCSRMVTSKDNRAFDLYFLLVAHSQLMGEDKFYINLEDMGLSLGLPDTLEYTALRRQVIRSLKRLQNRYKLIKVKFLHAKDASITLVGIQGESFTISSGSIIQSSDAKLTLRLKFLLLIEALLKTEGKDLHSVSKSDLGKRFNINETTISDAFKDLED
ncbi:MAG: phospholipase D-like domain-containing protein [Candidatus Omnitrophica bacterium]|nr:phospholipase D-like domain-containing protein [Candidatus Omnitrophota bacterium]